MTSQRSQADLKFPSAFSDNAYLTASLKKSELIARLQVPFSSFFPHFFENLIACTRQNLHNFLKKVGQSPAWQKELLDDLAAALIQPDRLGHKDETVRLLVACALSDIIRIYAPDAPYSEDALQVPFSVPFFCYFYFILSVSSTDMRLILNVILTPAHFCIVHRSIGSSNLDRRPLVLLSLLSFGKAAECPSLHSFDRF